MEKEKLEKGIKALDDLIKNGKIEGSDSDLEGLVRHGLSQDIVDAWKATQIKNIFPKENISPKENIKTGPLDENDIREAVETLKKYTKIVHDNYSRDVISECASELDKSKFLKEFANQFRELNQSISPDTSVKDLARKLSDLAGKPTMDELKPAVRYLKDLSEKVAGLNLDMADKMSGSEKADMASKLNKLILDGKLTEGDFDGIVLCGFPKDSIQMWKELYKPANERKKRELGVGSFRRIEQPVIEEPSAVVAHAKFTGECCACEMKCRCTHKCSQKPKYEKCGGIGKVLQDVSVVQAPMPVEKCTDCGSPERDMTTPKTSNLNFDKNDRDNMRKFVSKKLEPQNELERLCLLFEDTMKNILKSDIVYVFALERMYQLLVNNKNLLNKKSISDIESYLIWTHLLITKKQLHDDILKTFNQHKSASCFIPGHFRDCDSENKVLALIKSIIDSLEDAIKDKEFKESLSVMFEEDKIPNKCNCDENSECSNCPKQETKDDCVIEFTDEDNSITANEIRWTRCSDGSKIQQFYKGGILVKEEKLEKVITNKVKCKLNENGLEKRSYYKGDQFVRSVDAFGDVSDKPKSPVVARNIEEIAKERRDEGQNRRDRLKEYRVKTENEWKNSINNTQKILEKKNKPEELSGYEQIVKNRQNKDDYKSLQDKAFGEVSGDNLKEAAKTLAKYADSLQEDNFYPEDNFIATPIDVKGTDTPFRRKLPNKIEQNVVEKQDQKQTKQSITEMIRSFVKTSEKKSSPKPMFDLSLWQKTKVYFRDLKNKTSTLFKSPEITEEEVDRAIRLMEKQIAEIKKSRGISPDLLKQAFDQKFDYMLPRKDRKYPDKSTDGVVISAMMQSPIQTKKSNKVILDEKSKEQLSEYKDVVRCCNSDSVFMDDELRNEEEFYLTENKLYNLHKKLMSNFNCFCEEEQYPHLRNLHNKIEKYHSRISFKEETPKFKEFIDVYSDFLLEVELLIK